MIESVIKKPMTGCTGVVSTLHPRGFGFITRTLQDRKLRIYFHLADSDGTAFAIGDHVMFDVAFDSQMRPRAYNVKLDSEVRA